MSTTVRDRARDALRERLPVAVAVLVSLFLGLLASATPARAAAMITLDPGARPAVASNLRGDAVAIWWLREGGMLSLRTTSRGAGGDWRPIQTLLSHPERKVDADLEPRTMWLSIDARGAAHFLVGAYARQRDGRDEYHPAALAVWSSGPDGAWVAHELAGTSSTTQLGSDPLLAVSPSGTAIVAWTEGPAQEAGQAEAAKTLFTAERSPEGVWSGPRSPGSVRNFGSFEIAFSPAGAAVLVWDVSNFFGDGGPPQMATRAPDGSWSAARQEKALSVYSAYGSLDPVVDAAGVGYFVVLGQGPYGVSGLQVRKLSPAGGVTTEDVPKASKRQRLNGVLGGSWYVGSPDVRLDSTGQLVVVFSSPGPDVEEGGRGVGTIWAATRSEGGRWSVRAIDPLGEATAAQGLTLNADASGRLIATWSALSAANGVCASLRFRAIRRIDGSWTPRALIGADRPRRDRCDEQLTRATESAEPVTIVEETDRPSLSVRPQAPVAPPVALKVEDFTTTWSAVRRAGKLDVPCRAAMAGHCSVSIVRSVYRARQKRFKRQALDCFAYRATAPARLVGRGRVGLSFYDREGDCGGWVPPTMSFRVLVTYDVVGHASASRRIIVTVRR